MAQKQVTDWMGIVSAYMFVGLMHALYFDSLVRDIFGPDNGPEWVAALAARIIVVLGWPLVWLDKLFG